MLHSNATAAQQLHWSKAYVVGLGATGFSCACYLDNLGIEVFVFDTRKHPPFADRLADEKPNIKQIFGSFEKKCFVDTEVLVVSPGVSLSEPAIQDAREAGVEIIGDIELFCRVARRPVIGITGSNGKSTVTTLTEALLIAANVSVLTGGNIGRPALDLLTEDEPDYYLLELSSFQLESVSTIALEVGVILNVSPDHMDRYENFESYLSAKTSISRGATTLIVNRDDHALSNLVHEVKVSNLLTFGLTSPLSDMELGVLQHDSTDWLVWGSDYLLPAKELKIEGRHNVANALAAFAIASTISTNNRFEKLQALREFEGLPHRCELIRNYRGVAWINDSKGTNVGATVAALEGMHCPVILIAGGQAKQADFSPLEKAVRRFARQVVLYGEDREQISRALHSYIPVTKVTTLQEATALAFSFAQPGDAVLFSPACASFDMFDSFEHRGDAFKEIVLDMQC